MGDWGLSSPWTCRTGPLTWKFESRTTEVLAGAVAFSFHLGVDLLQVERSSFTSFGCCVMPPREHQPLQPEGLDFKPFWCPVFWVFLPDVQALWHGQAGRIHVEHKQSYKFRTQTPADTVGCRDCRSQYCVSLTFQWWVSSLSGCPSR